MPTDNRKSFILTHVAFLLSLVIVYFIPYISAFLHEVTFPPMNRYFRFYIIGVFSLVFLFYGAMLYFYNKAGAPKRYFWLLSLSVFILLCASQALLSFDLYEYSIRGRMAGIYGINPYLYTPIEIKNDPFFPLIFWKNAPECYGPLWVLIGTLHTLFFKNSVAMASFLHKFILLVFLGLSAGTFYKLCVELKFKKPDLATLAFVFNPLVIIMTLVDGHNEIAMVFFILAASYFLLRQRYVLSLAFLALAVNLKFVYLIIAPLFVLYIILRPRYNRKAFIFYDLGAGAIVSSIILALLWLPFGMESVRAVFKYYGELSQNFWFDSIPFAAYFLLAKIGINIAKPVMANIFSAIFFAAYCCIIYRFARAFKKDSQAVFSASGLIILWLLFTNYSPFQAWYLLWVIPFLLLSSLRSRFLLVFLLSYFLIMNFWKRMSVLAIPMFAAYFLILKFYKPRSDIGRFIFSLE